MSFVPMDSPFSGRASISQWPSNPIHPSARNSQSGTHHNERPSISQHKYKQDLQHEFNRRINRSVLQREVRTFGEIREFIHNRVIPDLPNANTQMKFNWGITFIVVFWNIFFLYYHAISEFMKRDSVLSSTQDQYWRVSNWVVNGFELIGVSLLMLVCGLSFIGGMYGTGIATLRYCGSFSAFKLIQAIRPKNVSLFLLSFIKDAGNSLLNKREKKWQKRVDRIKTQEDGSPIRLIEAEIELSKVLSTKVEGWSAACDQIFSVIAIIILTLLVICIPALAVTIKIRQLRFVADTTPNNWAFSNFITFFGFLIQLSNIADERVLRLDSILHFIFANEDAKLDEDETRRMGMVDHMMKQLLVKSGFRGFLMALAFDGDQLTRFLLKPLSDDDDEDDWGGTIPEKMEWVTIDSTSHRSTDEPFILLRWSASPKATEYRVEYRVVPEYDGAFLPDGADGVVATQYQILRNSVIPAEEELSSVTCQIFQYEIAIDEELNEMLDEVSVSVKFRVIAINAKGASEPSTSLAIGYPFNESETGDYCVLNEPKDPNIVQMSSGWASVDSSYSSQDRVLFRWSPIFMYKEMVNVDAGNRKPDIEEPSGTFFENSESEDIGDPFGALSDEIQPSSPSMKEEISKATCHYEIGVISAVEMETAKEVFSYEISLHVDHELIGEVISLEHTTYGILLSGTDCGEMDSMLEVFTGWMLIDDPLLLAAVAEWNKYENKRRFIRVARIVNGETVAFFKTCVNGRRRRKSVIRTMTFTPQAPTERGNTLRILSDSNLLEDQTADLMSMSTMIVEEAITVSHYPRFNMGDFVLVTPAAKQYIKQLNMQAKKRGESMVNLFGASEQDIHAVLTDRQSGKMKSVLGFQRTEIQKDYEIGQIIDQYIGRQSDIEKVEDIRIGLEGISFKDLAELDADMPQPTAKAKYVWMYDVLFDDGKKARGLPSQYIKAGYYNQFINTRTMLRSGFNFLVFFLFIVMSSGLVYAETILAQQPPKDCRSFYDYAYWVSFWQYSVLLSGFVYFGMKLYVRKRWLQHNIYPSNYYNILLRCLGTAFWALIVLWAAINGFAFALFVDEETNRRCLSKLSSQILVANVVQILCASILGVAIMFQWCLREKCCILIFGKCLMQFSFVKDALKKESFANRLNFDPEEEDDTIDAEFCCKCSCDKIPKLCRWKREFLCWKDPVKHMNAI